MVSPFFFDFYWVPFLFTWDPAPFLLLLVTSFLRVAFPYNYYLSQFPLYTGRGSWVFDVKLLYPLFSFPVIPH